MTFEWTEPDPSLIELPGVSTTSLADCVFALRKNLEIIEIYRNLSMIAPMPPDQKKSFLNICDDTYGIAASLATEFGASWFTDEEERVVRYCLTALDPSTSHKEEN